MKKSKIAIIQLPGSNCEYETLKMTNYYGFDSEIIRWNTNEKTFDNFDAYIIPGGFSYQDRIRAGAIASKLPIMQYIKKADKKNKLILGICNGCQILAETGIITNNNNKYYIETALSFNTKQNKKVGFICDWVYIKTKNPRNSIFTKYFDEETIIPIQVNHGEGKFIFQNNEINGNSQFVYCSETGEEDQSLYTPNGSSYNIAGICNKKGTAFGLMPHPERSFLEKQLPSWLQSKWKKNNPWDKLFVSIKEYTKNNG